MPRKFIVSALIRTGAERVRVSTPLSSPAWMTPGPTMPNHVVVMSD